jgi:hypothetical protein
VIPDDIWCIANLMLKCYGDEADELGEAGDKAGEAVSRRII